MIGFYATQVEHDYAAVSEHPDEEAAMAFILGTNALGNARSTTMKAYTPEEFSKIVDEVPG